MRYRSLITISINWEMHYLGKRVPDKKKLGESLAIINGGVDRIGCCFFLWFSKENL